MHINFCNILKSPNCLWRQTASLKSSLAKVGRQNPKKPPRPKLFFHKLLCKEKREKLATSQDKTTAKKKNKK